MTDDRPNPSSLSACLDRYSACLDRLVAQPIEALPSDAPGLPQRARRPASRTAPPPDNRSEADRLPAGSSRPGPLQAPHPPRASVSASPDTLPDAPDSYEPVREPTYESSVESLRAGDFGHDRVLPLIDRVAPLLARDAVQAALERKDEAPTPDALDRLLRLDRRLEDCRDRIFTDRDIEDCRDRLAPAETAWWWFLEAPKTSHVPAFLTQFDAFWNLGTAVCLTFAATFITQTVQAFSTRGFDVLGTVGTIAQGAGLAFVAKGTLTNSGKEKLHDTLDDLGIPHALHQEVTFLVAASVLATSYGINQNLYRFSDYYYNLGQRQEDAQQWSAAKKSYARAMDFSSGNTRALLGLGSLLEKLGEYEQAAEIYRQGIPSGDPNFFNALGRSHLRDNLQRNGWQGQLQRAVLSEARSLFARARLHDETHTDAILATDVYINLGIAHWAAIDFNRLDNTPTGDRSIFAAMQSFNKAVEANEPRFDEWIANYDGTVDATTMYPWQLLRAQCFEAAAEAFAVVMDAPSELLPQATYTEGLDPRLVFDHVAYSCNELLANQDEIDAANNSILLESILLSERVAPFSTSSDRGFASLKKIDPAVSTRQRDRLKAQLVELIEAEDIETTTRMPLINRVVVDRDTNVVAVYAYDVFSLAKLRQTPTYQLQQRAKRLGVTPGEPVADFWVNFRPQGEVEIVPWHERYVVDRIGSQAHWKTRLPVKARPDRRHYLSELGILRALVYAQLRNYSEDVRDWQPLLDRKLVYQILVAADGRIVGYAPAPQNDNEATRRLNVTPLTFFPAEDAENEAVAWFSASFKSSQAFQLDSGQRLEELPVWDIPE
ncbi:MAG: hypothetical protein ACFB9N_10005 [Geitlerinemataceae cyanobacterium]